MRTEEGNRRAKEIRAKYNRENMKTLGVNVRKEEAEKFTAVATKMGLKPSRLIHDYVDQVIREGSAPELSHSTPRTAYDMRVSPTNFDLLYRETSLHNPKHLNPEELMNDILARYFKLAEELRQTSKA